MELPKRVKQHQIDTKGLSLLQYVLPQSYILRSIGERDYGIDAMMELAFGEEVTGKFISVQLKSSENITWSDDGLTRVNIPKKTCNYWMQNNMPFILFLADIVENKVFYCDIKAQIRQRYKEYIEKENFSFILCNRNELHYTEKKNYSNSDEFLEVYGYRLRLLEVVINMVNHNEFENELCSFVSNWKKFFSHIKHQYCDPFLVQPISFYHETIHIYQCLLHISNKLNLGMSQIDFNKIRNDLKEAYEEFHAIPEYEVIEYEITIIHSKMAEEIEKIIYGVKNYILNTEKDYWNINNPYIFQEVQNIDWNADTDYDW